MSVETPDRLVLCSEQFLTQLGTRTERGDLITAAWGEPDNAGLYEPRFTVHSDDNLITTERERIRARAEAYWAADSITEEEWDRVQRFISEDEL